MLGTQHFEMFFFILSRKKVLTFHTNCLSLGDNLHKISKSIFWDLLSAESSQRVVKVKNHLYKIIVITWKVIFFMKYVKYKFLFNFLKNKKEQTYLESWCYIGNSKPRFPILLYLCPHWFILSLIACQKNLLPWQWSCQQQTLLLLSL